jgi:hypothetical protein
MKSDSRQSLTDHVQAALPLLGRLRVTAQQQLADAVAALGALERATEVLRSWAPIDGPRHTANLEIAVLRSGHSLGEIAYLTAIPEARLRALVAGEMPSSSERVALATALPDWLAGGAR